MDGEGQTDKEKRPKLALTKCKVVPGRQERERLEPSQAKTFFLELASPTLAATVSRRIVLTNAIPFLALSPQSNLLLSFVFLLLLLSVHYITVLSKSLAMCCWTGSSFFHLADS